MRIITLLACLLIQHLCHTTGLGQIDDYRLWIAREYGGNGYGKIFSVNLDGSGYDNGVIFESALDGLFPIGKLLKGSDGFMYGATRDGGMYNRGVIFKMSQDGSSYQVLHHFTKVGGAHPFGRLVESSSGKLYGVSRGAEGYPGVVFSLDISTNNFQITHEFKNESEGTVPTYLMLASNGNLYGTCERKGNLGLQGTIFTINLTNNVFSKIMDADGLYPGALMEGSDGRLYGTFTGGYYDLGQIYSINPDGTGYASVLDFYTTNSNPSKDLVEGADGYLYGTCSTQSGKGIFKVRKNGLDFSIIHTLTGGFGSGLTLAEDGLLYGVAYKISGPGGYFFRVKTDGSNFENLEDLNTDFTGEVSVPVEADNGSFFVTSMYQGRTKKGFVSKFLADGSYSIVKEYAEPFCKPYDLINTQSGLWGSYITGGVDGKGGVFKLSKDGYNVVTRLHENTVANNTWIQLSDAQDSNGNLYNYSGDFFIGKFTSTGILSKIFDFPENATDWQPVGPLFLKTDFLYGVSVGRGTYGKGALYRLKTDGTGFTIIHSFTESTFYRQSIAFESDGILFGVTKGGANGLGLIYTFDLATNTFKKIFDITNYFGSISNKNLQLIKGADNTIYGLAKEGGTTKKGAIFKISMDGSAFQELRSFSVNDGMGYIPTSLVEGPDGKLYGVTAYGGDYSSGAVFSLEKDGSDYQIVFHLPEEKEEQIPTIMELLLVPKMTHSISMGLPSDIEFNEAPIQLPALSDAGLPVVYSSSNPDVAKIQGTTLTFTGVGSVTITAEQTDNNFYTRYIGNKSLTIVPGIQQITFDPIPPRSLTENSFELGATSSSGLPVVYSTTSDKIILSGNKVTLLSPGSVTIVARQSGNENYNAATPVELSFCINPPKPIISEERISNVLSLTSSNDTGNQWYFNGNLLVGETSKTLTDAGNGTYSVSSTIDNCGSEVSDDYFVAITGLENLEDHHISIYPNPTEEKMIVEIADSFSGEVSINIVDASGKIMLSRNMSNRVEIFEMKSFTRGLYFVQLRMGKDLHIKYILKI